MTRLGISTTSPAAWLLAIWFAVWPVVWLVASWATAGMPPATSAMSSAVRRNAGQETGLNIVCYLMFLETTEAMSSAAWMTLEFIS